MDEDTRQPGEFKWSRDIYAAPNRKFGLGARCAIPPTLAELLGSVGELIYAVKMPDGIIKIGHTTNLYARMSKLGVGVDVASLLAVRVGGTRAEEQAIHTTLQGHAIQGREWYHPCPVVLALVEQMRTDMRERLALVG